MSKKDLSFSFLAAVLVTVLSYPTVLNVAENLTQARQVLISVALGALTIIGLFTLHFLERWVRVLWQLGKFIVVGGLNTFVDFGVLNLLIIFTDITSGSKFSFIKGVAFTIAVVNSYFWNKHWTFEFKERKQGEILEFLAVSVVGLGLNVGVASLLVNQIGPLWNLSPILWANVSAFAATLSALASNFVGYKFIVFRSGRKKGQAI
ncbi:MAG: hypothetical protein UX16_C0001G0008 [Parcubacteria group bacterium GW2011_GWB1_45_7]|nr:MAG: hypothetical protein UX16_C0001G0008 [Parcubacteria group bacterium GW2011_GWB1_45_7]